MPNPAETAARAAEALVAYWTRAPGQDMLTRDLCRRLAEAVERDSPVPLAGVVEADPERGAALVQDAVRSAAERSPAVRGLCTALVPEPPRSEPASAPPVVQHVTVTGGNSPVLTVGGNFSGTVNMGTAARRGDVPEASRRESARPELSILFAAADPSDQARLRLSEEIRRVREQLDLAQMRDRIALDLWTAVRPEDFVRALLQVHPQVVHFSGHGHGEALCFQNTAGNTHEVSAEALRDLFREFTDTVRCVVLNACSTTAQARAIAEHVPHVIGMSEAIGDRAAMVFSTGFYQALGAGCDIPQAFRLGCTQLRMQNVSGHSVPFLLQNDGAHGCGDGAREGKETG
jgi:hypothetical protein